ncbi:MAG: ferrochelatase [Cytophagaceae bacterium]|nr:ferrochelatase [Cytophagaceae bacterium]
MGSKNYKALKTGILLINLGTPDSPETGDVRKYLREFLMDRRVIDIPYLNRFTLINFVIVPLRAPKSSKVYKELWDEKGSPLLYYGLELKDLLQKALGNNFQVAFGMRYQSPSIESAMEELEGKGLDKILVIPLFPQYASASTGSAIEKTMEIIKSWEVIPEIKFISNFLDHPLFIKTFAAIGKKYLDKENYDHYIFTYHGLPERQIKKASVQSYCQLNDVCCSKYHSKNKYCYRAQCFETTRLLVKELNIPEGKYTVAFQSRLGKNPWIKPYTDEIIKDLAKKGVKSVLAFSPSFVADCLETTIEGGVEYRNLFKEHGGERWQLVESLNVHPMWVECLKEISLKN